MRCRHWQRRVEGSFSTFRSRLTSRNKRRESKRSFNGLRALAVLLVLSNGPNATYHVSERWLNCPPWNNPKNTNNQGALHHGSRTAALNYNYSQTLLPSVACQWTRHSHYDLEVRN